MKNIITKELLNTVLNTDAIWTNVVDNEVHYGTDNYEHSYFKMNLDTFTRKCKEWTYEQGYGIETITMSSHKEKQQGRAELWTNRGETITTDIVTDSFIANTELEAIFKACEWILNQTKDNI